MGDNVAMAKTLTIFLAADVSKLNRQLKGAQNDLSLFSNGISGLSGKLSNLMGPALIGAAAAAGAFAVKLGVDGVKAAIDDEAALAKLTTTLNNVGLAHKTDEIDAYLDALEQSIGYLGDLRPAYDRLIRSTRDTAEANRALEIALDVSAGTGRDLDSVVQALGRAFDGNTAGLSRLGAGIDSATLKTGDMQLITAELASTFGGQASRQAETFQGQLQQLQRATEQVAEALGRGLLNSLGETSDGTTSLVKAMEDLEPLMEGIGAQAGETATSLLTIVNSLASIAGAAPDAEDELSGMGKAIDYLINDFPLFWNGLDTAAMLLGKLTGQAESVPGALSATVSAAITAGNAMAGLALKTAAADDALANIADKPSKAFYQVLGQLNKGAVETTYSMDRFDKTVTQTGASSRGASSAMSQLNTQSQIGTAKFDAQAKAVGDLNAKFKEQTQDLVNAKDAIANYASTLSSEITRGFNLGAGFTMNNGEVDAQAWLAGVDSEVAKYEWYGNVLAAVQRDAGTNGEALRAYLASQGIDQGATMGQALIDSGLVATMGDKLATVTAKADEVAQTMVPEFLRAGEDSAIEFLNGTSQQLSLETDRLKKIGKNIGKPIGANIAAEIAAAVAQAVKDAEAARSAALAEVSAREAARTAAAVEQATAQNLARLIRNSDSRAGRNVQPVLA
jgi:hypothetical protein